MSPKPQKENPFIFLFGHTMWHVGSQFPHQGLSWHSLHWAARKGPRKFIHLIFHIVLCCESCIFVWDSLQPHGLQPARLLCPWNSLGKNTEMGCYFLLQGIFLTQGSNPGLLHCRQILHHLSRQGIGCNNLFLSWNYHPEKSGAKVPDVPSFLSQHRELALFEVCSKWIPSVCILN